MEFTVQWLSVPEGRFWDPANVLHAHVSRSSGGVWYVLYRPISDDRPPDWRCIRRGEDVLIPVYRYLVQPGAEVGFAFGFQQAVRALTAAPFREIRRCHIALVSPARERDGKVGVYFGVGCEVPG